MRTANAMYLVQEQQPNDASNDENAKGFFAIFSRRVPPQQQQIQTQQQPIQMQQQPIQMQTSSLMPQQQAMQVSNVRLVLH